MMRKSSNGLLSRLCTVFAALFTFTLLATLSVSHEASALNSAPVATAVSKSTTEDTSVTINLIPYATDAERNALKFYKGTAYQGTVTITTAGSATFKPSSNVNGTTPYFTFYVTDTLGAKSNTAKVSLTVAAVNDAPTASAVTAIIEEDNRGTITLKGTDVDGDALTYQAGAVTNGTATVSGSTLTLTPTGNFNGTATFNYKACDRAACSADATGTVTVTAVNDIPTTMPVAATTNEDTNVSLTLLGSDRDGDSLTYCEVYDVVGGEVESTCTARVGFIPAENFNGVASFKYKAYDGTAYSEYNIVTITVRAVNDAPVASDVFATTEEDAAVTVALSASDVDGDTLTYTFGTPLNGSFATSGSDYIYTPSSGFSGTDTFTYTVSDGTETDAANVTVTVTAKPVVFDESSDAATDPDDFSEGEAEVTLSEDGVPQFDLYYADTASDLTRDAATELKNYLDKITGGSFTLTEISAAAAETTKGIFVGTSEDFPTMPDADRLVEDADQPATKEAFAILSMTDQIWIGGVTDVSMSNGVVRFLEMLGCRWFFQGENWEVVPSTPTLTFNGQTYEQPSMVLRSLGGNRPSDPLDSAGNAQTEIDMNDWKRHNHLAYTSGSLYTGVALPLNMSQAWGRAIPDINTYQSNFLNLGGSSPPDNRYAWHATGLDLTAIEIANSSVRDAYWTWLKDQWATLSSLDANGISMPLEPADGVHTLSESPEALSLGSESDMMVTFANDMTDRAASDLNMSDRYATFMGGYGRLMPPTIPLTGKTYVSVFPVKDKGVGSYTTTNSLLEGWAAQGAKLSIYLTLSQSSELSLLGSNYSQSLDGQSPDYARDSVALGADFKSWGESGLTAASLASSSNFGAYGLGYYLIAKLMYNTNADVAALREDFFAKAFGPAQENMRKYYDLLDPQNQPQLISQDLMAEACAYLAAAATDAASDSAVLARINDLKLYMHHNALWWQIFRSEHNSDTQKNLVRDLLGFDTRIKNSYMTNWVEVTGIVSYAARQFADGSTDWDASNASASWRAISTFPEQAEIDAWFAEDMAYFAPDPVTQLSFSGQPEAVSDFSGTQGSPTLYSGLYDKPITLALYTPTGTTALTLGLNVGQFSTTSSPASPLTVTLTDDDGNSYGTQTVNPGPIGSSSYQDVTFTGLPENTGFHAALNGYGSVFYVRGTTSGGVDMPMALESDKISRSGTSGMYSTANGFYFYVPKGTTEIQYYWNRHSDSYAGRTSTLLARPFSGTGCYLDSSGNVTTPNDDTLSHCVVDSDGNITTVSDFKKVIRIPVSSGADGKLWRILIRGPKAKQLWFYNIPPYLAQSPSSMVIPHDLVVTDGLTPR